MRFTDTVSVLRASGPDEYGNPGESWSTPVVLDQPGFLSGATLYLPPSADLRAGDRVRVRGRLFAVDGEPAEVRSPSRLVLITATVTPMEAR